MELGLGEVVCTEMTLRNLLEHVQKLNVRNRSSINHMNSGDVSLFFEKSECDKRKFIL